MSLQLPFHILTYLILIITLLAVVLVGLQRQLLNKNVEKRSKLLAQLGIVENNDTHNISGTEKREKGTNGRKIAGFLHPYCNAGGGGERVLWTAIAYLQRTEPDVISVVYTGDIDPKTGLPLSLQKDKIIQRTKERFGITLDGSKLHFVHLKWRWLVEDTTWKRLTMLGQGIGAALLAVEVMYRLVPDVFLDTHGLAFSYPIVRFLTNTSSFSTETGNKKLPIVVYTHYPTISASMLHRVSSRQANYANDSEITKSTWRSTVKLLYYRLFSYAYTSALLTSPPTILTVNSSWTRAHVEALLAARSPLPFPISLIPSLLGYNTPLPQQINEPPVDDTSTFEHSDQRVKTIYPPCDVSIMDKFPLEHRQRVIFGCAQFRPEKDHVKQITALAILLESHPEFRKRDTKQGTNPLADSTNDVVIVDHKDTEPSSTKGSEPVQLVLLGSARHQEDLDRVEELKRLAKKLKVEDQVSFVLNAPYDELLGWLARSSIGISTMVEEHFGIGVVEFMGAGLIPVVHASGGPIMDIVTPFKGERTGFFADSAEEFANQLYLALTLSEQESLAMRQRARLNSKRFSVEAFENGFGEVWKEVKEWIS